MGLSFRDRPAPAIHPSYNGQIYFVPTTCWQLATWAVSRSTCPVLPDEQTRPTDLRTIAEAYAARTYAPVLWYTPNAAVGDEIYDFLHRLPGLGRIVVFTERPGEGLRDLDRQNLEAMLDDSLEQGRSSPFFERQDMGPHELALFDSTDGARDDRFKWAGRWLELNVWLREKEQKLDGRFANVVIVVPDSPHFACAVVPLAAYVQATLIFVNSNEQSKKAFTDQLVDAVFSKEPVDEIWLVGPSGGLQRELESAIKTRRHKEDLFDVTALVRVISGNDHFAVAEQAALLLLTYRYLDWIFVRTLTDPEGRECWFSFLAWPRMRRLFHYCNRVLDLADQVRQLCFLGIMDKHDLYWSMSDEERRDFITCFEEYPRFAADTSTPAEPQHTRLVANSLAVVADYASDGTVPHHLIDAAGFAARKTAPLLLLQPLPAEMSYYIGSLMDKIDDRLNEFSKLQVELVKERARLGKQSPNERMDAYDLEEADRVWQERKSRIEALSKQIPTRQQSLRDQVYKTGEVLYQSLVPLAIRSTLHKLQPKFLVVFIQDPSLPVELIREGHSSGDSIRDGNERQSSPRVSEKNPSIERDLDRFWSLRYAIGHMSSVNFYETNLTSNISFFTPPVGINPDELHVLLCSNPTRDLFFSGQEATKIAVRFGDPHTTGLDRQLSAEGATGNIGRRPKLIHLKLDSKMPELKPTRSNFIGELRKGHDIVHYSGHAFFDNVLPGRSGLVLCDGVLTASDVRFMLDFNRSPIIYANACLAGRIKSVSSRFTGLAAAFIAAGAAGYISPLWSIDDRDASALAVAYYDALLNDSRPIGQCLQIAKKAQAKSGSITWASYVLYGDPTMPIVHPKDETDQPQEETR
jgi:hypothetical protein